MNYGIHITYEVHHPHAIVRHGVWAGSKEQMKLVDYHERMRIALREIEYVDMNIPLERTN